MSAPERGPREVVVIAHVHGRHACASCMRHLQLPRAANVTGATVPVTFDGGKTWRAARMTGATAVTRRCSALGPVPG
ncbi:MAG TPA: hypothetical protein VGI37_08715 [Streptosporangiaceae bacterium]